MSTFAIGHAQLLTLAGSPEGKRGPAMREVGLVSDGAVLVREGRIEWVGPTDDLPDRSVDFIDAGGNLVSPGFVDSHTHLAFVGHRANEFDLRNQGATYQEIAAAGGGILSSVRSVRGASDAELHAHTLKHARWLLQSGTTAFEAKSGYGLTAKDEARLLRSSRSVAQELGVACKTTFLGCHSIPPEAIENPAAYVQLMIEQVLPQLVAEGLVDYADMFVEERYFPPEAAERLARMASVPLRLHVDQFASAGGAELAVRLGAKSADHLEVTGASGVEALARSESFAGLLPGSVTSLGRSQFPPARDLLDAGAKVVLATDFNPGSSPVLSMATVMNLARLHMKISAEEAWNAATLNAAASLDWGRSRGSIEEGKCADLLLWDVDDYREVGYWQGLLPRKIWVAGNLVTW